jgi:hypothetical protein
MGCFGSGATGNWKAKARDGVRRLGARQASCRFQLREWHNGCWICKEAAGANFGPHTTKQLAEGRATKHQDCFGLRGHSQREIEITGWGPVAVSLLPTLTTRPRVDLSSLDALHNENDNESSR